MKKLLPYLLLFILAGGGISCSDDDPTVPEPEAVMPPAPTASDITSDSFAISWEAVEEIGRASCRERVCLYV